MVTGRALTHEDQRLAAPLLSVTAWAVWRETIQVDWAGRAVSAVAAELGVNWRGSVETVSAFGTVVLIAG